MQHIIINLVQMFPTVFSWTVWRIWGVGPWSTVDPSLEQDDIQLDQSGRRALKWYFNTVDQLLQQSWKDLEGIKLKLRWGESTRVFCRFHFLKQSRAWQDLPIWGKRGQKQKIAYSEAKYDFLSVQNEYFDSINRFLPKRINHKYTLV